MLICNNVEGIYMNIEILHIIGESSELNKVYLSLPTTSSTCIQVHYLHLASKAHSDGALCILLILSLWALDKLYETHYTAGEMTHYIP